MSLSYLPAPWMFPISLGADTGKGNPSVYCLLAWAQPLCSPAVAGQELTSPLGWCRQQLQVGRERERKAQSGKSSGRNMSVSMEEKGGGNIYLIWNLNSSDPASRVQCAHPSGEERWEEPGSRGEGTPAVLLSVPAYLFIQSWIHFFFFSVSSYILVVEFYSSLSWCNVIQKCICQKWKKQRKLSLISYWSHRYGSSW